MARPGRPTKATDVVAHRPVLGPDGEPTGETTPVTAMEQIVADIRSGMYAERAARRAGVHRQTFYEWESRGRKVHALIDAGETTWSKLNAHDKRCAEFSDAVEAAEVEWETRSNAALEQLGRGGVPLVETTTKVDGNGNTVETRTKRAATLPDASVLQWRLERKFPDRYGRRGRVEHTGAGGGPIAVQMQAEQILDYTRGLLDGLGVALTDDVRQLIAQQMQRMSAIEGHSGDDDDGAAGVLARVG